MMKPRLLFVDDEINLIDGLKRLLRPYRHQWNMVFASNGPEAIEIVREAGIDLLLTDVRMPEVDGAALLKSVVEIAPASIRFVLSGQADQESARACIGLSHQFLSKPKETAEIIALINDVLLLQQQLPEHVSASLTALQALPTPAVVLDELFRNAREGDFSLLKMSSAVDQDMALSAKILQLANSAYFGVKQDIFEPDAALQMLELNEIKRLRDRASFAVRLDRNAVWAEAYLEICTLAQKRAVAAFELAQSRELPKPCQMLARQMAKMTLLGPAALSATGHMSSVTPLGGVATQFLTRLWGFPDVMCEMLKPLEAGHPRLPVQAVLTDLGYLQNCTIAYQNV